MRIKEALEKFCPLTNVNPSPVIDRFCVGNRCMAWRWQPGHESPREERAVWYGEELYPLPALPGAGSDDAEQDELVSMLRHCHAQIRANIVRAWTPAPPAGEGWTLHDKFWDDDQIKPCALFWRPRLDREGTCNLTMTALGANEIDRSAW